jgi:hypothetical protein
MTLNIMSMFFKDLFRDNIQMHLYFIGNWVSKFTKVHSQAARGTTTATASTDN